MGELDRLICIAPTASYLVLIFHVPDRGTMYTGGMGGLDDMELTQCLEKWMYPALCTGAYSYDEHDPRAAILQAHVDQHWVQGDLAGIIEVMEGIERLFVGALEFNTAIKELSIEVTQACRMWNFLFGLFVTIATSAAAAAFDSTSSE